MFIINYWLDIFPIKTIFSESLIAFVINNLSVFQVFLTDREASVLIVPIHEVLQVFTVHWCFYIPQTIFKVLQIRGPYVVYVDACYIGDLTQRDHGRLHAQILKIGTRIPLRYFY